MRQRLGQNFLIDKTVAEHIVAAAGLTAGDEVVEIGPGKGVLTALLAPRVKKLTAIEIDRTLARRLEERFKDAGALSVVAADFMAYDISGAGDNLVIVANLPYYIATAVIEKILPERVWKRAVVMVQKEVAERITAEPGDKAYGAFTVFCRYFAQSRVVLDVGPESFSPRPAVSSSVIALENRFPPPPDAKLFALVRCAFSQRRKTVLNSLAHALKAPKAIVAEQLTRVGIRPDQRPGELTLEQYQKLEHEIIAAELDF